MVEGLIGKKIGMSQRFDDDGNVVPVTVIQAGPCTVIQKKTTEKDGYLAVQLGFVEDKGKKRPAKAQVGHFKKSGVPVVRKLQEVGLTDAAELKEGDQVLVDIFAVGETIHVSGTSKGKGFAGVVKRHHFAGGGAAHGSMFHRAPGSIGASSYPSRVVKGMRMGGHMGARPGHGPQPHGRRDGQGPEPPRGQGRGPRGPGGLPPDPQGGLRLPERRVGGKEDTMGKLQVFDRSGKAGRRSRAAGQRLRLSRQGPPRLRGRRQLPGQPAPGDRRDQDAEGRQRRRQEALAAEGHGPGPRRQHPVARSGGRAARSSGPSRRTTPTSCRRRPAGTPCVPPSPASSPTASSSS